MNTWEDLEKLEENWDSYRGLPPTKLAIETGKYLVNKLQNPCQIFPSPDGGVSLEWDLEERTFVLSIDPDGTFSIYAS